MNLDSIKIGSFLQSVRKQHGMTQAQLAEKLMISPQSVSNWERGETIPDVSLLPDLSSVLHTSIDAILSAGSGSGGFRRHITVAQMQEALSSLDRIGHHRNDQHTDEHNDPVFVFRSAYIRCIHDRISSCLYRKW